MRNKGFGLLEVLISLLIISVGVAGIIGLQKHMRKKSALAEEHLIAARIAQESFEGIRTFDKTNFTAVVSAGVVTKAYNHTNFTLTRTAPTSIPLVTSGGITTDNQLKKMTVNVAWNSLDGVSKVVSFSSAVSPVATFKSNDFFGGGGSGSTTGPNIIPAQDPTDSAHRPPVYVENYEYFTGDQMLYPDATGDKYMCTVGSRCRDHDTFEPRADNTTNAGTAWVKCTAGTCPDPT
ncbi:type IV pilus modification PilV family protein [Motilimonas cestriensis]|uniref:type IV pilus modification PilV family protein n=1 Tax=Motilimonas cestriensis TaxID=2742685 RepID=UPI003DA65D1D